MRQYSLKDVKRFWSHVKPFNSIDECWYTTYASSGGYPSFSYDGYSIHASRFVWLITYGDPGYLLICHRCDNTLCINPMHMFLGTDRDNMKDMVKKGRQNHNQISINLGLKGEKHPKAKLTWKQVEEIRRKYSHRKHNGVILAKKYNIDSSVLYKIIRKEIWIEEEDSVLI